MIDTARRTFILGSVATLAACATAVSKKSYPARAVRLVIPFPPGGSTEVAAKILAERLQIIWGVPVTVDPKPGNVGENAMREVAGGDGHTLLVGSWLTNVYGVAIRRSQTDFAYVREIVPVTRFLEQPWVFVVTPGNPASSARELFENAKRSGGTIATGADFPFPPGTDIDGAAIERATGVQVMRVPTTAGATGILADLSSGKTQYAYLNPIIATQAIREGKLRPLAIVGPRRMAAFPAVPTLAEAGLPQAGIPNWHGVFAPATMPAGDLAALHAAIVRALDTPEVASEFSKVHGTVVLSESPMSFAAEMQGEAAPFRSIGR